MLRAFLGGAVSVCVLVACGKGNGDAGSAHSNGGAQSGDSAMGGVGGSDAAGGHAAGGHGPATGGAGATGGSANGGTSAHGGATGGSAQGSSGKSGASTGAGAVGGTAASGGGVGLGGTPAGGGAALGAGGANSTGGTPGGTSGAPSGEPGVRIVGRTEPGTQGPRFSWPGVSFAAHFSGTQASVQLADAANANEFEVIVNGADSQTLVTASGQTTYPLVSGLTDGEHDVVVWRRTEAYYNPTEFLGFTGFSNGGALLAPPAPRKHRIEVIGDSITVGYGNEGMPGCKADTTNENNYVAYASVAAREVNADLVTIAWSGIGMYRNYDEVGPSTDAMPSRYDRAVPTEDDSTWDFSAFTPEAVVINLGTNDYSTMGDPGQPFVNAYVSFVEHVRSKYPTAYLLLLIQASGSDVNINQVVSTEQGKGETAIESFDINVTTGGSGCDGHPDVVKDQAMGDKLAGELSRVLGW